MRTGGEDTRGFPDFLRTEQVGGVALGIATVIALIVANSPAREAYDALRELRVGTELWHLDLTVQDWARDGLLALFFFVIGLELKREFTVGELARPRVAAFPVVTALGGIIVPALLAAAIMWGEPGSGRAWVIPTATDIAFALGVLALVGAGVPRRARTTLLALAVVDDLVAIVLIAVLFTGGVHLAPMAGFILCAAAYAALQRMRIPGWWCYVPIALSAWTFLHASGIHATIAGVVLGLLTRAVPDAGEAASPAARVEHALHPWSALGVVPIFAFLVAGVPLDVESLRGVALDRVALGVFVGLVVGKFVGILGAAWIAERVGIAVRPPGADAALLRAIALLGGIGFTVSLLVTDLALDGDQAQRATTAVLLASGVASLLAAVQLRGVSRASDVIGESAPRS